MILIIESGSTKSDWHIHKSKEEIIKLHSEGMNPYFHTTESIEKIILNTIKIEHISEISQIYFYGAGCSNEDKKELISSAFKNIFKEANIEVQSDIMASARAVLGNQKGIVAILGTGSNSCLYDGENITKGINSLGYILGDEGSGAHLGKMFLNAYFNNKFSTELNNEIDKFDIKLQEVLDNIYRGEFPNRYLASYSTKIAKLIDFEEIRLIVKDSFLHFFKNMILIYPEYKNISINFVGSIAFYFKDIIWEIMDELNLKKGEICKQPIDKLVVYHTDKWRDMRKTFLTIILFSALWAFAQKEAYNIFKKGGKISSYEAMLEAAKEYDIILFGEFHDDAIAHWLQFELISDLHKLSAKEIIVGAEMFESDNQTIIDEYFEGRISESNFKNEVRLWKNYNTDYRAILEYARENKLKFVATNIPRRYAAMVNNGGFEALEKLSKEAKSWIAPLPIKYNQELQCYKSMLEMNLPVHNMKRNPENFPKAQAIKDATMAHFIYKNHKKNSIFIHLHGAFHSDNFEAIYWYLKEASKKLKIMTISISRQENVNIIEENESQKADFIIVVNKNIAKTH